MQSLHDCSLQLSIAKLDHLRRWTRVANDIGANFYARTIFYILTTAGGASLPRA